MTDNGNVISFSEVRRVKCVPMDWQDTTGIDDAAFICGVSGQTIRRWCKEFGIGRQIKKGACWRVSRPAARAMAAADMDALEAIRNGDKASPLVARYFAP